MGMSAHVMVTAATLTTPMTAIITTHTLLLLKVMIDLQMFQAMTTHTTLIIIITLILATTIAIMMVMVILMLTSAIVEMETSVQDLPLSFNISSLGYLKFSQQWSDHQSNLTEQDKLEQLKSLKIY